MSCRWLLGRLVVYNNPCYPAIPIWTSTFWYIPSTRRERLYSLLAVNLDDAVLRCRPCWLIVGDRNGVTSGYRMTAIKWRFFFWKSHHWKLCRQKPQGTVCKLSNQHSQDAGTLCIILIKSEIWIWANSQFASSSEAWFAVFSPIIMQMKKWDCASRVWTMSPAF